MSAETNIRVDISPREGHIALEGDGTYTVFQTALPLEESFDDGRQYFTYARVQAGLNKKNCARTTNALRLTRSGDDGHLIPEGEASDMTFRGNILVLQEHEVDGYLRDRSSKAASLGYMALEAYPNNSTPLAERLYKAVVAGPHIGLVLYDACATYGVDESNGMRITILDESGGCSIGLPPSEGIVSDEYLQELERQLEATRKPATLPVRRRAA